MGSRALYDWVDQNPTVELHASDFTNDPLVIAKNARMVAINSALSVDLTGQVASDTLGGRFFSGIEARSTSFAGRPAAPAVSRIIALPSTRRGRAYQPHRQRAGSRRRRGHQPR